MLFQVQNSFSAALLPRQNTHWSKTIAWWLEHLEKPVVQPQFNDSTVMSAFQVN